ncbi:mRNA-decapping enzyme subunit 2 [Hanseniaspora osmophila]|uniref:mRNA-decapping enzyme subunit 2 n=1 Tax=Hanseniaspora osmophila TaxID=56408 RepID=A0A1E5RP24_9ASCO|nr:mRNA-decapping enzyme subunit 2 [Hanseniaspora osmophila]
MSLPLRSPFEDIKSLDRAMEDLLVRFVINCPEEDLSSEERVMFQIEEASWFYLDYVRMANINTQESLPKLKIKKFATKMIEICPLIWKWDDETISQALQKFSLYKKTIPVRGAAIFNETLNKILLVQGIESKSWSFPRGKISKDESDVDCCIRECLEETGFDLTNYINENEYLERNIGGKNYKIYLVKGVPKDTVFEPRAKFEIEDIRWIDFRKIGGYATTSNGNQSSYDSRRNQRYYLVNSMWKAIYVWVKKQKQLMKSGDKLEMKQNAERELKMILGLIKPEEANEQEVVQENGNINSQSFVPNKETTTADPGRDLLNILQSAVKKSSGPDLIGSENNTNSNLLPTINGQPSQIPLFPIDHPAMLHLNPPHLMRNGPVPPMMSPYAYNTPFAPINAVLPDHVQQQLSKNMINNGVPGNMPIMTPDGMVMSNGNAQMAASHSTMISNNQPVTIQPETGAKHLLSILKKPSNSNANDQQIFNNNNNNNNKAIEEKMLLKAMNKPQIDEIDKDLKRVNINGQHIQNGDPQTSDAQDLLNLIKKPIVNETKDGHSISMQEESKDNDLFYKKYHQKPDIADNKEFFQLLNRNKSNVTAPSADDLGISASNGSTQHKKIVHKEEDFESFDEFESSDENGNDEFFDATTTSTEHLSSPSNVIKSPLNANSSIKRNANDFFKNNNHVEEENSEDDLDSLVDENEEFATSTFPKIDLSEDQVSKRRILYNMNEQQDIKGNVEKISEIHGSPQLQQQQAPVAKPKFKILKRGEELPQPAPKAEEKVDIKEKTVTNASNTFEKVKENQESDEKNLAISKKDNVDLNEKFGNALIDSTTGKNHEIIGNANKAETQPFEEEKAKGKANEIIEEATENLQVLQMGKVHPHTAASPINKSKNSEEGDFSCQNDASNQNTAHAQESLDLLHLLNNNVQKSQINNDQGHTHAVKNKVQANAFDSNIPAQMKPPFTNDNLHGFSSPMHNMMPQNMYSPASPHVQPNQMMSNSANLLQMLKAGHNKPHADSKTAPTEPAGTMSLPQNMNGASFGPYQNQPIQPFGIPPHAASPLNPPFPMAGPFGFNAPSPAQHAFYGNNNFSGRDPMQPQHHPFSQQPAMFPPQQTPNAHQPPPFAHYPPHIDSPGPVNNNVPSSNVPDSTMLLNMLQNNNANSNGTRNINGNMNMDGKDGHKNSIW